MIVMKGFQKGNTHSKKHGYKKHPVYKVVENIFLRCYNTNTPQYKDYGGRGITVYEPWIGDRGAMCRYLIDLGYSPDLTLDRVDNNKGYIPDNLRWTTRAEQNRNSRACKLTVEDVHMIRELYRKGKLRSEIAKMFNVNWSTVNRAVNGTSWA